MFTRYSDERSQLELTAENLWPLFICMGWRNYCNFINFDGADMISHLFSESCSFMLMQADAGPVGTKYWLGWKLVGFVLNYLSMGFLSFFFVGWRVFFFYADIAPTKVGFNRMMQSDYSSDFREVTVI